MSRREFFKKAVSRITETAVETASAVVEVKRSFLRPPGAIPETTFLLTCTRCGDCKPACPYQAIHLIGMKGGIHTNTPFIDPQHTPCRFCEDMPCIDACTPKALTHDFLKMGIAQLNPEHCLIQQGQHCDYCFKSCPADINAISKSDSGLPQIDSESCVGCGKCEYICVSQTDRALLVRPYVESPVS